MQVALSGLLEQLEKHRIESELILVEWNPPPDKPLLKDVLKWPEKLSYCTIRAIVVPPSIHQRYEYSDKIQMNVIAACNCAMRRARGQFILLGGIDLLYSDELMSFIAAKNLRTDAAYRVSRCDVDRNVVQCDTLKEQLVYCRDNIIRIKAHTPQRRRWTQWVERGMPDLHTSAAGDFLLLSRDYWHLLHGYPEADIVGAYSDGLFCYMAYAAGIKEVILNEPMRFYHIDHDGIFTDRIKEAGLPFANWVSLPFLPGWLNSKIISLYRRFLTLMGYKLKSTIDGIPTLSYTEYRKIAREMVAGKRSYTFNDDNWGLGQDSLEKFIINTAVWDKEYGRN